MRRLRPAMLVPMAAAALLSAACGGGSGTAPAPSIGLSVPTTAVATTTTTTPEQVTDRLVGADFGAFIDGAYHALLLRTPQRIVEFGLADVLEPPIVLDDLSDAHQRQTEELEAALLAQLRSYDRSTLSKDERISYDTFEWHLDQRVQGHRFRYHEFPVHYFLTSYNNGLVHFFTDGHPLEDVDDAEAYITRVGQIGRQVDQVLEGLEIRRGLGISPPDFVIDWTIATLREDLSGIASLPSAPRPAALPLFTAFVDRTSHLDLDRRERGDLHERLEVAIADSFVPGWQALIAHLEEIRPDAPSQVGVGRLPEGADYYQHLLVHHTTTDLSADQIHDLGQRHVERVQTELMSAFDALGYDTEGASLGTLRSRARRDAGFLDGSTPQGEAAILAMLDDLMAAADGAAKKFFSGGPEGALEIVPEPAGRGGFYVPGSSDGTRPGAYHAGIQGDRLPRLTMPTVLYHETIPGHHFQITLAQELPLPDLRRFTTFTGYTEGWGLYAERLADEMGLYANDPHGRIGQLELELLRAVRLVVDTGIHSRGWTRDQARSYMVEAMGDGAWTHEVERYISYPGQATAYLVGQQAILDLRNEAERSLGDAFDIVAFHDTVLGSGAMPLDVLRGVVQASLDG